MNRHYCPATVGMLQETMAAANARHDKTRAPQRGNYFPSAQSGQARHKSDGDTLHADKLIGRRRRIFGLQTQLNGLSDSLHQFVQRTRLRMATAQFGHAGHVVASLVPLDDDAELMLLRFRHDADIPEKNETCKAAGSVLVCRRRGNEAAAQALLTSCPTTRLGRYQAA